MKNIILISLIFCLSPLCHAQELSILLGATAHDSVQVNVLVPKEKSVSYSLSDGALTLTPVTVVRHERSDSPWATDVIFFNLLREAAPYTFLVHDSSNGTNIDERTLTTLDSRKTNPRIAFASCMNDRFKKEQVVMWDTLAHEAPDLILFVGDNNYAAKSAAITPVEMWEGYVKSRLVLKVFRQKHLIPILATWDDHDFGADNGNKHYPYVKDTQQIFEAFYAQTEQVSWISKGPGVSRVIDLFGQRFLMLDGRSFQTTRKDSVETFFGLEQEDWMKRELMKSSAPTWIVNGTLLFGKYQFGESIEKTHKQSFVRFVDALKSSQAPLVFVAGDVHFSQVQDLKPVLGFSTLELTSSSIHSNPNPIPWWPNPRQVKHAGGHNFLMADTELIDHGMKLTVASVKAKGKRAFTLKNLVTKR